jgi:hypothetical protein
MLQTWDISDRAGPTLIPQADSDFTFVAWSKDGERLMTAGRAGFVRIWASRTLETEWVAFQTSRVDVALFDHAGRILRSTPAALKSFVYMVERGDGRIDLLTYAGFEDRAARIQ